MLKVKSSEGQQFDCPMEVGHIIDVDNIKYTVTHANKIQKHLLIGALIQLTPGGVDLVLTPGSVDLVLTQCI